MAQRKKGDKRVVVGDVTGITGEVNIAAGDIYKGYTAEQVSILLTQISSQFKPKPFDGRCPYKGLEVFEEEDADLFFGRERLVEDLLSRVKESRTIFITGPSGSGKSSLVRAGLLHSLKKGALKGSEGWLYETMKPGREPLKELALAFSRLKSPELANYFQSHANEISVLHDCAESVLSARKDQRFVLFVDQFEEVFTQVNNEQERGAFLNMLAHAGTAANGRVIVLFAMRSDFVSNCATYPALNELLGHEFRQIGAMQPEELVSAIALPARHVGLPIEDELIARIINDMKGEPGALPLMQFALKDLFDSQQAQGGVIALTLEDYLRHGGIHKSLERHANKSFARLDSEEQDLARSIFSGLIEIGRGTSDTRRTALFDELVPADAKPEDVESIIRKLADARLIITDEHAGKDTVTISHEKLIDAWPWLKKLVNENRDVIALQNEIASDAKEWEDHGRDPSYLYTGARLVNAREQLAERKLVLSGLAQEFVQASSTRQRRGQMSLFAGVSAIIVLLTVAVIIFSRQAQQNRQLAHQAQVRALAAESVAWRDRNLPLALLLGVEAFNKEDNVQTRGVLLDNVQFNPQLRQFLRGHTDAVHSVAVSPDGKMMASGGDDGAIILWDLTSNQPIGEPLIGHTDQVLSVAFSPSGTMLASGSADNSVLFWDVNTHQKIGEPRRGHTAAVHSVSFSPDGGMLVSGSADRTILFWDLDRQAPDGPALAGHGGAVLSIAFSPDGKKLASGSNDNTVALWDLTTRQMLGQPLRRHLNQVTSVAFSPDGNTLASASFDDTVILWDVANQRRLDQPLAGHTGEIFSLAFHPDGKTLVTGSADTTVILWDIRPDQRIDRLIIGNSGSVNSLAFHPAGEIFASGSYNGDVILWDANRDQPIGEPLRGHESQIRSIAFSPDGQALASGSDDNTIILWDINTRQPLGSPLRGHSGGVYSVAFHPGGDVLASAGNDDTVILWDTRTHEPIASLQGHAGTVYGIAFSPDGKVLATASADRTIILWNVDTHLSIGEPLRAHLGPVSSLAFGPDGRFVASGSADNSVMLWDLGSTPPAGQPLAGSGGAVMSLAFSPDGRTLASGISDRTIILWDIDSRRPIGQPLRGHTGGLRSVIFRQDGKLLVSGGLDQNIVLWDLDPVSWLAKSCQRVGRNLTYEEWTQYFPNEEYRKTCDQFSLER